MEFWGHEGITHFEISKGQGQGWGGVVKIRKLSVVWYGYFLESAILTQAWGENIRRGTLGGTQYNTVRKIGKYWNTMSKIDEIQNDTAFMISHAYLKLYPSRMFIYLKHVCTRNQPQL